MVFRASRRAAQIVRTWLACPRAIRRCREWRLHAHYEQSAFNIFIRPMLAPGELVLLPCEEANGYPKVEQQWRCKSAGATVNHYWGDKPALDSKLHAEFEQNARLSLLVHIARSGGLQPLLY